MIAPLPVFSQVKPISIVFKQEAPKPPEPKQYTTVSGDTLTSIADAQGTTVARLWAKNTALTSPDQLDVSEALVIPTNEEPLQARELPVKIVNENGPSQISPSPVVGFSSSGNAYDYGWCTWYVKNLRPELPNNLGNAYSWFTQAAADGLSVGYTPRVGAVAVAIAYSHVALVTGIHGNLVDVTEMNYVGWNKVSSRTAPISEFRYVY